MENIKEPYHELNRFFLYIFFNSFSGFEDETIKSSTYLEDFSFGFPYIDLYKKIPTINNPARAKKLTTKITSLFPFLYNNIPYIIICTVQ